MDSLGSRHPRVISVLGNYLRLEAIDKKGIEATSKPFGKQALVSGMNDVQLVTDSNAGTSTTQFLRLRYLSYTLCTNFHVRSYAIL